MKDEPDDPDEFEPMEEWAYDSDPHYDDEPERPMDLAVETWLYLQLDEPPF